MRLPHKAPFSLSRRNVLIRSVAGLTGDVALGFAAASACLWIIEAATLGLFLSFLLWLISAMLALAVSQYVLHPSLGLLLSDRKLDAGVHALAEVTQLVTNASSQARMSLWDQVHRLAARFQSVKPAA